MCDFKKLAALLQDQFAYFWTWIIPSPHAILNKGGMVYI